MWDDLNASCVEAFREEVEVQLVIAGQPVPIPDAAHRLPWEGQNLAGMGMERLSPEVSLETRLWLELGGAEGGELIARGVRYRITEVSADEAGMTRLLLARWR